MKRKLLLVVLLALLCTAQSVFADSDYTSKVGTTISDWTGATNTYGNAKAPDQTALGIVEHYTEGLTDAGTTIFSQSVSGLDNGTYMVIFYATANNARNANGIKSDASDLVYVYAGSDKSHKTYVTSHYADSYTYPGEYIVSGATVTLTELWNSVCMQRRRVRSGKP
ncbi:MAG: hypothetical protein IJ064_03110 [Bacteroidaceae bacterium]|nr:hypothetical protein [Bacteroidaceae bacterium]